MRKVVMLDKVNLNLKAGFDSITECAEYLGVSVQAVFNVVNGKGKSVHGKIVMYAEEYLLVRKKDIAKKFKK